MGSEAYFAACPVGWIHGTAYVPSSLHSACRSITIYIDFPNGNLGAEIGMYMDADGCVDQWMDVMVVSYVPLGRFRSVRVVIEKEKLLFVSTLFCFLAVPEWDSV